MCHGRGANWTRHYKAQIQGKIKQPRFRHEAFFALVERTPGGPHKLEQLEINTYELHKKCGYRA